MSADRQRWHVPTNDELEQEGAISPPSTESGERRRGLRRFLRVGRFRVPDDVAAKKHVGSVAAGTAPDSKFEPGAVTTPPAQAGDERPVTAVLGQSQPVEQISDQRRSRRTIRIDQSVKDRRGSDRGPRA